jgi:transposase
MNKHKSQDYKLSAVKYYLKSKNASETCKIFECSSRSLIRWVKKYQTSQSIERKGRDNVAYKVQQKHIKFIKSTINKDKMITMKDLLKKINNKYSDFNISRVHLGRVVKDLNITLKQARINHKHKTHHKKPTLIKNELKKFYDVVKQYNIKDIICIDETSLNSFIKRNHCYETIGKRCGKKKPQNNKIFRKYTGLFAINSKDVVYHEIYEKSGNTGERLYDFLKHFINHNNDKLIIMNNSSVHKNKEVRDLINENNNLLYSVPYQHYTNAIEGYFNVLKSRLNKKDGITYDDLVKNVKTVIKEIPKQLYHKLFIESYQRSEIYKPKKSRKKTLKKYKE